MPKIDQIMIGFSGGWNLINKREWQSMPSKERLQHVTDGTVQFFSGGTQLETMDALELLSTSTVTAKPKQPVPTPKVETSVPAADTQATTELEQRDLVYASYKRLVIAGPRWQIQRSTETAEEVPFSELRNRPSDDSYDLDEEAGVTLLAADLIADVYGIEEPLENVLPTEALQFFDSTYFAATLGDRFWEVSASDIREQIESNPFIRILASTDS